MASKRKAKPKSNPKGHQIQVMGYYPPELAARLNKLSKEQRIPKAALLRQALEDRLTRDIPIIALIICTSAEERDEIGHTLIRQHRVAAHDLIAVRHRANEGTLWRWEQSGMHLEPRQGDTVGVAVRVRSVAAMNHVRKLVSPREPKAAICPVPPWPFDLFEASPQWVIEQLAPH